MSNVSFDSLKQKGKRQYVDVPRPDFLYTIDQVAMIFQETATLTCDRVYFQGVSTGVNRSRMLAVNIGRAGEDDWRISESELNRYLRLLGFTPRRT